MQPLRNERHEKICLLICAGFSAADACRHVEMSDASPNVSRLISRSDVKARLAYLRGEMEDETPPDLSAKDGIMEAVARLAADPTTSDPTKISRVGASSASFRRQRIRSQVGRTLRSDSPDRSATDTVSAVSSAYPVRCLGKSRRNHPGKAQRDGRIQTERTAGNSIKPDRQKIFRAAKSNARIRAICSTSQQPNRSLGPSIHQGKT